MKERLSSNNRLTLETMPVAGESRLEICLYCANKGGEACGEKCAPEGKYRYLSPEELPVWETFREITFSQIVDWSPAARLAALYLMAHYK